MKRILAVVLALVLVLSCGTAFAEKTRVQPTTQVPVPADLQVSRDGSVFVDRLGVKEGNVIAVRASLGMQPVRDAFLKDYNSIVDADNNGTADPVLEKALRGARVTGEWELKLEYPNLLSMPDSVVNGTNMDGFSDNAKNIFVENGARTLTEGDPYNTFVIKVKVKDAVTVGYLMDNLVDALGDMTFTAFGVVVDDADDCQLKGVISGTTKIETTNRFVDYSFAAAEVKAELYVILDQGGHFDGTGVPDDFSGSGDIENVADPDVTGVAQVLNTKDHIVYLEGYPDGTIRPEANVTRAEATTMLYRLLRPEIRDEIFTLENSFGDVEASLWYNKAVSSMANGGYVHGYEDGNFYGDNEITRAELVTIVARFAKAEEAEVPFSDVDDTHWAYEYISTAVANGWIGGYEDGSFKPEQPITRAETAAIINRVLARGVKSAGVIDGIKKWPDNPKAEWYYYEMVEATNEHTYRNQRPNEFWKTLHIDYEYDIVHYERP